MKRRILIFAVLAFCAISALPVANYVLAQTIHNTFINASCRSGATAAFKLSRSVSWTAKFIRNDGAVINQISGTNKDVTHSWPKADKYYRHEITLSGPGSVLSHTAG